MRNIKYTDSAHFTCLEHLRETSMDLFLIHCGKEHCLSSHTIPLSCRDEYIIHFVISGKGTFTYKGKTHTLTQGQMFLIYPGDEISYSADAEEPWHYSWVGFGGIRVENILKDCGFSKKSPVLPFEDLPLIMEYIDGILAATQLSFSNDLKRKSYLLLLFSKLIDDHAVTLEKSSGNRHDYSSNIYLEHAIEFIKLNHELGINVTDIANYIGISRIYLNQIFQKELGISVQKFLVDYRMHKAASLLASTKNPINEIAQKVGYDDPLAFSKVFKKKFEMSPKHYREHREEMDCYTFKQP